MTLAEANARAKKTFTIPASLTITTYDIQIIFISQAIDVSLRQRCKKCGTSFSQNGFSLKIICFKFEIEVDIVFDVYVQFEWLKRLNSASRTRFY